jgi:hypothetical protein
MRCSSEWAGQSRSTAHRRTLLLGRQPAKLGAQLLRRPDNQRLELIGGADLGHTRAVAGGQQHPQRLPIPTTTRRERMVTGQRLPGGPDRVQGIALGPSAPQRPLGMADLHHPLTAGLQERCQPGAVAAGALDRPAAPTGHLRPGEVEQTTVTGRVRTDRRLGKQTAHRIGGGGSKRVAVSVDADNAVDGAGQRGHRNDSFLFVGLIVSAWRHRAALL